MTIYYPSFMVPQKVLGHSRFNLHSPPPPPRQPFLKPTIEIKVNRFATYLWNLNGEMK